MRNAENILRHELIGLECEVVGASNESHVGIRGKIVDETMKTVVIDGKVVEKKGTTFRIKLDKQTVDIDGNFLLARPEDRIKKKLKRW
jgi:ribonuclease P protein subunit POP4